jgi:protoporphyrinogen oxidase
MQRTIAVLGGGVAGVVAARELARDGSADVLLFEGERHLGGLQRSVAVGGLVFDIGAFVFDPGHPLFGSFPTLRDLFPRVDHHGFAVTPSGTLDRFPMSPRGFLRDNGVLGVLLAGGDLLASKLRHRRRDSLPSYLRYYLGERLYHACGLASYVRRFFSADEAEIDLAFARQRLGSIADECSLRRNALRVLQQLRSREEEGKRWRCHVRPPGGFGAAYAEIATVLARCGVSIHMGSPIRTIVRRDHDFLIRLDDGEFRADRIVSSIPLGAIADALSIPIARRPEYVRLYSLFFRFRGEPGYDSPFLYNFTHDGLWKRITLLSRYYGTDNGDHYLVVECTGRNGGEERLGELATAFAAHMKSLPFYDGELIYEGGTVTPHAYPICWRDGQSEVEQLRRAVLATGIEVVGRQGRFEHISSHAAASDSRRVATRVREDQQNVD